MQIHRILIRNQDLILILTREMMNLIASRPVKSKKLPAQVNYMLGMCNMLYNVSNLPSTW
jgi:hypothetical protein